MRLICTDGTRYTKDIDIVRKCACTKKCYWLEDAANHNSNNTEPIAEQDHQQEQLDTVTTEVNDSQYAQILDSIPNHPQASAYTLRTTEETRQETKFKFYWNSYSFGFFNSGRNRTNWPSTWTTRLLKRSTCNSPTSNQRPGNITKTKWNPTSGTCTHRMIRTAYCQYSCTLLP